MAGECWVGFEVGLGPRDPADPSNLPSTAMWSSPCTFATNINTAVASSPSISSAWRHRSIDDSFGGQYSLKLACVSNVSRDFYVVVGNDSQDEWEIRWAMYVEKYIGLGNLSMAFMGENASGHCRFVVDEDGIVRVYNEASALIATSTDPLFEADDVEIEVKVLIKCATVGTLSIYVRDIGNLEWTLIVSTSGDFNDDATPGLRLAGWLIEQAQVGDDAVVYLDDIVGFPVGTLTAASKYVLGLRPTGDSLLTSTPSSGALGYAMVDDDPPDTADYTRFLAATDRDLYHLEDLGYSTGTVWGVSLFARARCSTADPDWTARVVSKLSTDVALGSTFMMEPSTEDFRTFSAASTTAPDSAAWTPSKVRSLVAGMEIVAAGGSGEIRESWFGAEVLVDLPDPPTGGGYPVAPDVPVYRSLC